MVQNKNLSTDFFFPQFWLHRKINILSKAKLLVSVKQICFFPYNNVSFFLPQYPLCPNEVFPFWAYDKWMGINIDPFISIIHIYVCILVHINERTCVYTKKTYFWKTYYITKGKKWLRSLHQEYIAVMKVKNKTNKKNNTHKKTNNLMQITPRTCDVWVLRLWPSLSKMLVGPMHIFDYLL